MQSAGQWAAAYDAGVPRHLEYPAIPVHGLLETTARESPDLVATVFGGVVAGRCIDAKLTYADLDRLADRFAAGLQRLGIAKGDRVALVLPNCPQFIYCFFGVLKAGAVVVPTNPLYTVRELRAQLADSGARVVVVLSRLYPQVAEAATGTSIERIVVTNIKEHFAAPLRALFSIARERKEGHRVDISDDRRALWLRGLIAQSGSPTPVPVAPADLAVLQYTGGTTGIAKGAMLSHRALVVNAHQCRAWHTTMREGDRMLAVMPFFHVYGLTVVMNLAVLGRMTIVLIPRPDLKHIFAAIEKHRPRFFPGAPRIYILLNESRDLAKCDLRSIESFLSGSAPLPVEVMRRFEELTGNGKVMEGYGLTEAAPVTHSNPREGQRKPGSVGVPRPDVECRVVDLETGTREVALGEVGELCVRGPNLMDGYWRKPEETALALRDGWLYTGDIVRMDTDGYFFVVDRKKEMIIVSGFKVYPREVDEILYKHPAILEAAAVGVPHPSKGEVVKAFVVLRPGMKATPQEIVDHCRANLAPFKVPVEVVLRESLPKTLIGKVLRRVLVEESPEVSVTPLPRAG